MIVKRVIETLNRVPRALYVTAALLFVGFLFWGGRQPVAVGLFPSPFDLLAHLAAYSVLTVLLWLAAGQRWPWLVVIAVGLVGLLDELQQIGLPGRNPSLVDGSMDVVAAVVMVGILTLGRRRGW